MIEELKTFLAVVDKKSFTKAAAAINISQPSVSLHISNLEKYFQTKLIERSNKQRSIFITAQGDLLYKRAKQILSVLEETKEELLQSDHSPSGTLRIGASMTIGEFLLPSILSEFMKLYPNIKLDMTVENTEHIYEKFKNYDIDIALIEGTVPVENYIHHNFYKDAMVIVAPVSFQYDKSAQLKTALSNQTWIHREKGSGTGENLNIFLNSYGISPKNLITMGSNYSIKEAVKNHMGISFISSLVVDEAVKNNEVKIIPLENQYYRYFSYLIHENNLPKAVELFLQRLHQQEGPI
uniref:LysR substrate-binding domain-containing protein n=1 Tax=Clostridium sp. 12(A) TaxID=1163671 RepID=UPI00046446AC|nr:LysR substrate-binding domain-containing protein [Clostridium sp. 12(A)]